MPEQVGALSVSLHVQLTLQSRFERFPYEVRRNHDRQLIPNSKTLFLHPVLAFFLRPRQKRLLQKRRLGLKRHQHFKSKPRGGRHIDCFAETRAQRSEIRIESVLPSSTDKCFQSIDMGRELAVDDKVLLSQCIKRN